MDEATWRSYAAYNDTLLQKLMVCFSTRGVAYGSVQVGPLIRDILDAADTALLKDGQRKFMLYSGEWFAEWQLV